MTNKKPPPINTTPVIDRAFKQVYDSPASLPERYKWLTTDEYIRAIEKPLSMPSKIIGVPQWVSGDRKTCNKCRRQFNWLDIIPSALNGTHDPKMVAQVILGEQKYVNQRGSLDWKIKINRYPLFKSSRR